jgi:hypothetical protein
MLSETDGVGGTEYVYNPYTDEYEPYEVALRRKMNEMFQKERFT